MSVLFETWLEKESYKIQEKHYKLCCCIPMVKAQATANTTLTETYTKSRFFSEQVTQLKQEARYFDKKEHLTKPAKKPPLFIRENTDEVNAARQVLTRTRQGVLNLERFITSEQASRFYSMNVDWVLGPFFAYFTWMSFIPRILINSYQILACLAASTHSNTNFPFLTRLQIALNERWLELAKDVSWFCVGLLNCFLLLGPLAYVGAYLSFGRQAFDAVCVLIKLALDYRDNHKLLREYQGLLESASPEETKVLNELIKTQKQQMTFDKRRILIQGSHAVLVVAALALTIPCLFHLPVLAIVGFALSAAFPLSQKLLLSLNKKAQPQSVLYSKHDNQDETVADLKP